MQLTLLDIITDIEGTTFCEVCYQPSKADCCSEECAKKWVEIYIDSVWGIEKKD